MNSTKIISQDTNETIQKFKDYKDVRITDCTSNKKQPIAFDINEPNTG